MIESNKPSRPLFGFLTRSKRCVKIPGTSKSPTPNEKAAARTNRSRRVKLIYESTRIPEMTTLANKKVVTPPRTGFGTVMIGSSLLSNQSEKATDNALAKNTPDILPRMPNKIKNTQHQRPAERLAHLVMAMTPLFYRCRFISAKVMSRIRWGYLSKN